MGISECVVRASWCGWVVLTPCGVRFAALLGWRCFAAGVSGSAASSVVWCGGWRRAAPGDVIRVSACRCRRELTLCCLRLVVCALRMCDDVCRRDGLWVFCFCFRYRVRMVLLVCAL